MLQTAHNWSRKLIYIRNENHKDLRKGKIIAVLLLLTSLLVSLGLASVLFIPEAGSGSSLIWVGGGGLLVTVGTLFLINRAGFVKVSGWLLSLSFLTAITFDNPENVVRDMVFFVPPILIASAVIKPWAGFAMAALGTVVINVIAYSINAPPNTLGPLTLFFIATIAYIAAQALETALQDSYEANALLEERVQERTAELQTALVDLQDARDKLKNYMSAISHDIRNPINSISGFAFLIQKKAQADQIQTMAQMIGKSAKTAVTLLNDLLDTSKAEAGELEMDMETVDLVHLVSQTGSEMQGMLVDKNGLVFEQVIDPTLNGHGIICGDTNRLKQVISNLLSNAFKFTPAGTVTLSLTAGEKNNSLLLAVKDTGEGIPEDSLEEIFKPFRQTSVGKKHGGGTGLGLPIVRYIVEAHHGRVWVESEVGQGTTFFVELPQMDKTI